MRERPSAPGHTTSHNRVTMIQKVARLERSSDIKKKVGIGSDTTRVTQLCLRLHKMLNTEQTEQIRVQFCHKICYIYFI
jgi:hypothetical protein